MNVESFLKNGSLISLSNDKVLVGFGPRSWLPQPGAFYIPDFFLENKTPWCVHEEMAVLSKEQLIEFLLPFHQDQPLLTWNAPDSKAFLEAFGSPLKKVVPYIMTTSRDAMTLPRLAHTLIYALSQSLYIYGYWSGAGGMVGATPELLLKLAGSTLETCAVAGTAPSDRCAEEFLNDPKECEEHRLVIEGITESLQSYGQLTIGKTRVLELSTLSHLMTPISLHLTKLTDIHPLIEALHPTPALGTFPKQTTWLRDYDARVPRKHYGAPFGYCYGNEIVCYVAIRNVQWTPYGMAIAAGCGIIAQSEQQREWKEVLLKTEAIQRTLGFATTGLPKALSKALLPLV